MSKHRRASARPVDPRRDAVPGTPARPVDPRRDAAPAVCADELERANQELGARSQRDADLMAVLSRDVGQPLTSIVGYAEMAIDEWEAIPDELKLDWVDRIHVQARRLGELVDDILAMYRLDAGAVQARRVPVLLDLAVDQALRAVPQLAGATARPTTRVAALADPAHLQQILVNLLANAAEHGRPPVQADARETGDGWVELRVRDHGEGVPPEFVPRLFDRFARVATGPAATVKGTGLGLFIAERLAEANGATLRYEPNVPAGSCFTLRLEAVRPRRLAPPGTPAGGLAGTRP